jgi:hypothetical protein
MANLLIEYKHAKFAKVNTTKNNISIIDSYKIKKRSDQNALISELRSLYTDDKNNVLDNRSDFSLICEWRTHNLLYALHVLRDHTGTVDLEYPQPWYMKVGYFIGSLFYWI